MCNVQKILKFQFEKIRSQLAMPILLFSNPFVRGGFILIHQLMFAENLGFSVGLCMIFCVTSVSLTMSLGFGAFICQMKRLDEMFSRTHCSF